MSLSIWRGTAPAASHPPLTQELGVDVAIVGGGITGVTTAMLLAEAGLSVGLVEAHRIGAGDTGGSTGNLYQTVSGGLHAVLDRWGTEAARAVARSRGQAVDFIERQAALLGPQCGFRRCPMVIYAGSPDGQHGVAQEAMALHQAGVAARLGHAPPAGLPPARGDCLLIDDQAQFHPLAYTQALAQRAGQAGARLFEQSAVLEVDRSAGVVRTAAGSLRAAEIVLATHSPSGIHGVQTGLRARREYGLAFRCPAGSLPPGIFWALGQEHLSMREVDTDQGSHLLCIGEPHPTGQHDAAEALRQLEDRVLRRLRRSDPAYRWSAQHFHSPDDLPYIGQDGPGTWMATGFGTDGLVYGTLAAQIIASQIQDRPAPWADLYKASRFAPVKSARGTLEESLVVAKALVKDYVTDRDTAPLQTLQPGQGAIVKLGDERVAAYRQPGGELLVVSAVCTHMKCMVHWNAVETSWDCPCHGSRFAPDGRVLEGPALAPLAPRRMASPQG